QLLLDAGSEVDGRDSKGSTPLYMASCRGHTAVVQFLLSRHADIHTTAMNNHIAFHIASFNGHLSTVQLLLDAGSEIDARNSKGETPLHMA
ncbi:ankyrin, partial [Wilcoxina mikolae CBS 423.85]